MGDAERQRLDSWKAIAGHLGRNVRTVIRWEQERGLPVHRVPGGRSGSVFAFIDELDAWLASRPEEATPARTAPVNQKNRRAALWLAAVLCMVMAGVAISWWGAPLTIGSVAISGDAIVALAPDGRPLWRYVSDPAQFDPHRGRIWQVIRNLDEAPGDEVVVAGTAAFEEPEALLALTNHGALNWLRSFDEVFTFGDRQYGPPWRTADLVVFGQDQRIAWAVHHHTWFPSVIATYDAGGGLRSRFVHPGWITSLRSTHDGRLLLAAGVNNELDARVLLVIDAQQPNGAVRSASSGGRCANCPDGNPAHYFVFPRPELSVAAGLPLLNDDAAPRVVVLPSGRIEVHIVEHPRELPVVETIYEFGPDLSFLGGRAGDTYWGWHRQLEAVGRIDHAAADCPERRGLATGRP